MKATHIIAFAIAVLIPSVFSNTDKTEPTAASEQYEAEVYYQRLSKKNIDGKQLVKLARAILEGTVTKEAIEGCQLVQRAKGSVVLNVVRDWIEGGFWSKLGKVGLMALIKPSSLSLLDNLVGLLQDIGNVLQETVICSSCTVALDLILVARRTLGLSKDTFLDIFHLLCATLGSSIIGRKSCFGLVDLNIDPVLHIADNVKNKLGTEMCGVLLQNYGCKTRVANNWTTIIDNSQPLVPNKQRNPALPPYKILHISDIHYDPYYSANVSTKCKEMMLCCQISDTPSYSGNERSGYWTDNRNCDVPLHFVDEALGKIAQDQGSITHVYFTGDIISHRVWNIDEAANIRDIRLVMGLIKQHFPGAKVFPILGNHEPHPLNLNTPDSLQSTKFSIQGIFDAVADIWGEFLPAGTDFSTVTKGGYYTVKEEGQPRIIALNSITGYTFNYWLIYQEYDYYNQLQWLADTLHQAEQAGEIVHILTHIPSGSGFAYIGWSKVFQKIVERYHHIIAGIFCGHTHIDELYVYYKGNLPINVGFNGGSITPYSDVNPNYKVLTVASDTHEILDIDQYFIDVIDANAKKSIEWSKLYSLKSDYGLSDLSPASLNDLVIRMAMDPNLRSKYRRNSVSLGPIMNESCDRQCQQEYLCRIVTNVFDDETKCKQLKQIFQ